MNIKQNCEWMHITPALKNPGRRKTIKQKATLGAGKITINWSVEYTIVYNLYRTAKLTNKDKADVCRVCEACIIVLCASEQPSPSVLCCPSSTMPCDVLLLLHVVEMWLSLVAYFYQDYHQTALKRGKCPVLGEGKPPSPISAFTRASV